MTPLDLSAVMAALTRRTLSSHSLTLEIVTFPREIWDPESESGVYACILPPHGLALETVTFRVRFRVQTLMLMPRF